MSELRAGASAESNDVAPGSTPSSTPSDTEVAVPPGATTTTPPLEAVGAATAGMRGEGGEVRKAFSSPIASLLVLIMTVLWTIPTLGLLVTSFRPSKDVATTGWWTVFLHPSLTLQNYADVTLNGGYNVQGGLLPYFVNSLVISIPATLIPLAIASMSAYALAWVRFRGSDFIFFTVFALQVVPLQMALIPLLQWFGEFHINGYARVWIAHTMFALPLAVFLLHNFMSQLPKDLMEAATVDGASQFLTFRKVVLPLSTPALASFAIFQFLWVWNDLLVALTFLGGQPDVAPVNARLSQLTGSLGSRWDLLTAGAFVSIIVPLVVFFALQRYFVRGLLAGSVKG